MALNIFSIRSFENVHHQITITIIENNNNHKTERREIFKTRDRERDRVQENKVTHRVTE